MSKKEFSERQIEIMKTATHRIHKNSIQELTIKNLATDLKLSEAALYRHLKTRMKFYRVFCFILLLI